jgi:hypothetical protein
MQLQSVVAHPARDLPGDAGLALTLSITAPVPPAHYRSWSAQARFGSCWNMVIGVLAAEPSRTAIGYNFPPDQRHRVRYYELCPEILADGARRT